MKKFLTFVLVAVTVSFLGGAILSTASPAISSAAPKDCNSGFLGFPAWYRGLTDANCNIISPKGDKLPEFFWTIALNIVEIALVAVGYISAFLLLWGGFVFLTSQGKPENAARARMTMLNAVIGLLISIAAVFSVSFIVAGLTK